jgi:hypothetical protein
LDWPLIIDTVGLVLLFSLGGIGTVVTSVRLWKVVVLTSTLEREVGSVRWFIEATNVVMLSHIEVCIIIICANFPGVAALRKHHGRRQGYVPHEPPGSSFCASARRSSCCRQRKCCCSHYYCYCYDCCGHCYYWDLLRRCRRG